MPNRTICNVLEAMRKCYETRNFAALLGLIEEAQVMADRMEAALWDQHDVEHLRDKKKKLEKQIEELEDEAEKRESEGKKIPAGDS